MKKLFPLFLLVLMFSTESFSQNDQNEKRPKAYKLSSGDTRSADRPKTAYLLSSGNTNSALGRPRVYKSEQPSSAKTSKAFAAFDLERRTFELINQRRENSGLTPLNWCDDAARIARLHSENMANFNFFSHAGVDGSMVNDRADLLGIRKWQAIGENIAYNQGFDNPVEFAVERWMQSPKHRDNLLSSRWKDSGIGIAVTGNGTYYFTEVFLVRK
ncbi:MAG TPA: CAP domain-containing protein [Pyrinomonadaceae bacterium]|nr:CAP domain-containing protein [Pyrinomonadaceae bacterium]